MIPLSSLTYIPYDHPHPSGSGQFNLPIKTLFARRWPINYNTCLKLISHHERPSVVLHVHMHSNLKSWYKITIMNMWQEHDNNNHRHTWILTSWWPVSEQLILVSAISLLRIVLQRKHRNFTKLTQIKRIETHDKKSSSSENGNLHDTATKKVHNYFFYWWLFSYFTTACREE